MRANDFVRPDNAQLSKVVLQVHLGTLSHLEQITLRTYG